jgi:hypothetical protein
MGAATEGIDCSMFVAASVWLKDKRFAVRSSSSSASMSKTIFVENNVNSSSSMTSAALFKEDRRDADFF